MSVTTLRDVPAPTRGSGPVVCCGGHRDRCTFGRVHSWSTWFENGQTPRTHASFHCHICGGVCTADEPDYLASVRRLAGELASFTAYPPERNAADGPCGACGYSVDAGKGLTALGSCKHGTFAVALHTWCAEDVQQVTRT